MMYSLWLYLCLPLCVLLLVIACIEVRAYAMPLAATTDAITRRQRRIFSLLLVAIYLIGLGIYWSMGSSQALSEWMHAQSRVPHQVTKADVVHWTKMLARRAQSHSNDVKAWVLLAKLQLTQHLYHDAAQSIDKARQLARDNIAIQALQIEINYYAHHQRLDLQGVGVAKRLVEAGQDDGRLLTLLALDAQKKKQYKLARQYWRMLLVRVRPDSSAYQAIAKAIDQTKIS